MIEEPDYLLRPELAELLRTSVRTLETWAYRHEGPPFARVGKRCVYSRADVMTWIESRTVSRAAP